ncbi:MAG: hypothetical protein Q8916_02440 [Bacteroidota bacterium]|nr:hypothetical protein [Bacteroidota bacterium]MDP4229245.1 hypothetical protein [Bacteroidota bacterium]MDP4235539.1 hypothetical protein [Bacteroidota bacterium]
MRPTLGAKAFAAVLPLMLAGQLYSQTGVLRGNAAAFSNATNTVSLAAPAGLLESYSLTLPTAQSGAGLFLGVNNGVMTWGTPVPDASGSGALLIGPTAQQLTTHNNQYLFDVEYAPGSVGPLPGAVIVSQIDNPNPSAAGLHVVARNTNAGATGVTINGVVINVTNAGTGTQTGLCANATGNGINYALILTGTSGNLCGIGTTTPAENLDVNGNIRISGVNGLKISEWSGTAATPGTMGTAVLAAGTKVVQTTSVTANSRIFLTTQSATNPGKLYVSARTAGTSFTISSTSGTDASTVAWVIVEP